jgi:tetratricopeptide (TPR) repeat protein
VKSSDGRGVRAPVARADLLVLLVVALGAVAVSSLRGRLLERYHAVKRRADVYALPSAEQTVVMSLGWRNAAADLVFAHVLVSYGIHIQEKLRFEFVGDYLETVNELDPRFRAPYRYADTLLTLGSVKPRPADFYRARKILERGMKERPYDAELWTQAGQFMAYLAPTAFDDPAVKQEWRLAGARYMARGCEMIGNNENVPYHCITAATLLSKAGEREATIRFLERVLMVVDDENVRSIALSYLQKTAGEQQRDEVQWRAERFADLWRSDLSFLGKDGLLAVGPPLDVAACAGRGSGRDSGCTPTWRSWGEQSGRR